MTLDLRVHRHWHQRAFLEFFESRELVVEGLAVFVQILNQSGHITDGVGVKGNSNDHPRHRKEALRHRYNCDVTKADSCESLQGPVKSDGVLEIYIVVYYLLLDYPARVREVLPFGLQEEHTCDQMSQK